MLLRGLAAEVVGRGGGGGGAYYYYYYDDDDDDDDDYDYDYDDDDDDHDDDDDDHDHDDDENDDDDDDDYYHRHHYLQTKSLTVRVSPECLNVGTESGTNILQAIVAPLHSCYPTFWEPDLSSSLMRASERSRHVLKGGWGCSTALGCRSC